MNFLKIKKTTIILALAIMFIIFDSGIYKVLEMLYFPPEHIRFYFYLLSINVSFILFGNIFTKRCEFLKLYSLACILFVFIEIIYSSIINDINILYCVNSLRAVLYITIVAPISYSIVKSDNLNKILTMIIIITMVSLLLRFYIVYYYSQTGNVIWEKLALDYATDNWIRNDSLRVNGSSISLILPVISLYLFSIERNIILRVICVISFITAVLFTVFGSQLRTDMMIVVISSVFFILSKRIIHSKDLIYKCIIISVLIYLAFGAGLFNSFIGLFTTTDVTYSSIDYRFLELSYFFKIFERNPILGIGYIGTSLQTRKYFIEDLGAIGFFLNYGIVGLIIYCVPIIRIIYLLKKNKQQIKYQNEIVYRLWSTCIVYLLIFSISHNFFFPMYGFSIVVIMIIVETQNLMITESE